MNTSRLFATTLIYAIALSQALCYGTPSKMASKGISASTRAILSSSLNNASRSTTDYVSLIIQVDDLSAIDKLADMGVIIYHSREDLLLTSVPSDIVEDVVKTEGVRNVETVFAPTIALDKARPFSFVEDVQNGVSLPQGYNGEGIVVGITDIGFDAQHIAFKDAVSALYHYDTQQGNVLSATTPAEIAQWQTDNCEEYHATHVANILGGRYLESPYYGVATGSDMVITTSNLTDVGILSGVESIIKYGQSVGKPVVINMSLGSNIGPHDGTDLFCQYLTRCAKDAIICLSSGNFGHKKVYASHLFTQQDSIASVEVMDNPNVTGLCVQGITDVWSMDSRPLSARFEVYDNDEKSVIYTMPWCIGVQDEEMQYVFESSNDSILAKYIDGSLGIYNGVSMSNNRFNVAFVYDFSSEERSSKGSWSRYRIGLAVSGPDNVEVKFYADGSSSLLAKAPCEYTCTPNADESISNLCMADGIIAVGSCNSRNVIPQLNDEDKTWPFDVNNVSSYTSYGTSPTEEPLPFFSTPGNYVVSALSTPYIEHNSSFTAAAKSDVEGSAYYWIANCGTSMASPMAAGIIALWLQADSSLTAKDVIDVARETCRKDFADIDNPRWGFGCLDAEAGLKYILSNSSIVSPSIKPIINIGSDRKINVTAPFGANVMIYDAYGRRINPDVPQRPGIYIVKIDNMQSVKIIVK